MWQILDDYMNPSHFLPGIYDVPLLHVASLSHFVSGIIQPRSPDPKSPDVVASLLASSKLWLRRVRFHRLLAPASGLFTGLPPSKKN